jgi:chromate reductase, NAD(P)H dehydrogenase (quinone)
MDTVKILGMAGSLRGKSYNRALLRAAVSLAPVGSSIAIFDLKNLPMFNQDIEIDLPVSVKEFKDAIKAADAILFVTPEHNYSVPAVLKNALDWASRPQGDNSWAGKPAAIMGASPGMIGSARAQYHLRQMFVTLDIRTFNKPEIIVGSCKDKFTEEGGELKDEMTRKFMVQQLETLVAFTKKQASA